MKDPVTLHRALLQVTDYSFLAICAQVTSITESDSDNLTSIREDLRKVASRWSGFSGNSVYPVPAPKNFRKVCCKKSPDKEAFSELDRWDGEYGDSRRDLLQFAIDYTKESIL